MASAKDSFGRGKIPVYHVHGFLPYIGLPRGELVLSEEDYNALISNPSNWANIVQVNLIRECTCLFIGLSVADPNLRRLLDLVRGDKSGDTYIIQKMGEVKELDPDSLRAWSTSKEFDRERFASIYLRTIWIHDYDEIPKILNSCRISRPCQVAPRRIKKVK